jgi:hypothetical protein
MGYRKRPGRQLFLTYLCCAWVAVLMAAPLVSALEPASAGATRADAFRQVDGDGDGYVSPAEAARIAGLSPFYERADGNRDGRLNRHEFRAALSLRDGR